MTVVCVGKVERAKSMRESNLKGKRIYAFGDSIVYGHTLPKKSFMRIIAEETGAELTMCAVNGSTVIRGDNHILTQVGNAPAEKPDMIIFDGYTNDAYERNKNLWGEITDAEPDDTTFCGGFEKIVQTMQQKWRGVPLFFVTIHKSGGREWDIQCTLRALAMEICEKYGVQVIDVFEHADLDTRDSVQMEKYIIGGAGSHPNEEACREFYVPLVLGALENR